MFTNTIGVVVVVGGVVGVGVGGGGGAGGWGGGVPWQNFKYFLVFIFLIKNGAL